MEADCPTAHPQLKGAGAEGKSGEGMKGGGGKSGGGKYGWKGGGKFSCKGSRYKGKGKRGGNGVCSLDALGMQDPYRDWSHTQAVG